MSEYASEKELYHDPVSSLEEYMRVVSAWEGFMGKTVLFRGQKEPWYPLARVHRCRFVGHHPDQLQNEKEILVDFGQVAPAHRSLPEGGRGRDDRERRGSGVHRGGAKGAP